MFGDIGVRVAVAAVASKPSLRSLSSLGSALVGSAGAGTVVFPILKVIGLGFAVTLPFHWKVTLPLMAIGALVAVVAFKVFFRINTSEANFNSAVNILIENGRSQEEIVMAVQSHYMMKSFDFEQLVDAYGENGGAVRLAKEIEKIIDNPADPVLVFGISPTECIEKT